MNSHCKKYYATVGLLATLLSATSQSVNACISVGARGAHIDVASEEAIIIWDAPTHTEHFIRNANFKTNARDFGFLVPTPSVPKLRSVDSSIFSTLDAFTNPPIPKSANRGITPKTLSVPAQVEVLARQQVAGLDATTLEASDAKALLQWLNQHGYPSQPTLTEWLTPYIANHWKITAFKIAKRHLHDKAISTPLVDMTFKTDHPFYPYREPAQQMVLGQFPHRLLRVYTFSTGQMEGALGPNAQMASWPGTTTWSNKVPSSQLMVWSQKLRLTLSPNTWLTRFDDHSSPRRGAADLFFQTAAQSIVTPSLLIQ